MTWREHTSSSSSTPTPRGVTFVPRPRWPSRRCPSFSRKDTRSFRYPLQSKSWYIPFHDVTDYCCSWTESKAFQIFVGPWRNWKAPGSPAYRQGNWWTPVLSISTGSRTCSTEPSNAAKKRGISRSTEAYGIQYIRLNVGMFRVPESGHDAV